MKTIYKTLTICGDHIESMDYLDGIRMGKRERIQSVKGKRKQKEIRFDSLFRTKQKLRRSVWCNEGYLKTFVTLTFADEIKDLKTANKKFHNFIKKMNYRFPGFAYIGVPEFQKRGVVHYHLLTNVPYIANTVLSDIWTWGFVGIKALGKVKNIARYLTKYLTKSSSGQDERFFNKKKIFYSKNIRRPQTMKGPKEISGYLEYFGPALKKVYEKELKIDFVGLAVYQLFDVILDTTFKPTTKNEFEELLKTMIG